MHTALQPYVNTYHIIELHKPMLAYQRVPASSKCMLNIPYGNPVQVQLKGMNLYVDRPFFLGLASQSYQFKALHDGTYKAFLVEFRDIGFPALFRENTRMFADTIILMQDVVVPDKCFDLPGQLEETVLLTDKVKAVEKFLLHFLPDERSKHRLQKYDAALALIRSSKGLLSIQELAHDFCISERQFRRIVTEIKGCSPKDFARLIRFTHIFSELMLHSGPLEWTDVVLRYQFFDQMHFIKEFKKFAVQSPTRFEKESYIFSSSLSLPSLLENYQTV